MRKKFWFTFLTIGSVVLLLSFAGGKEMEPAVLVFSKTAGFTHASIPDGNKAIMKLGSVRGFRVDTTQDASLFTDENLDQYSAVIFNNTTGDVLNDKQQQVFERYIQKGRGFVGIHAASDTEFDWQWYGQLVGAYFFDHPRVQQADLHIRNPHHPATESLPPVWTTTDEWYNFRDFDPDIEVLITIDEGSYEGGKNGQWHPIAWIKEHDGGRAFYTGRGHTRESYQDPLFLEHLLGGISYAMYGDGRLLLRGENGTLP